MSSNVWAVQVRDVDQDGDPIALDQRVVYADSELQARVAGAGQMKVDPERVTVTAIASNPSDDELRARWEDSPADVANIPDWLRSPGSVT